MSQIIKHVVFCTPGIFPNSVGGIQRHSRLLIEELAKTKQIRITVIHPHADKVFDPELQVENISLPFNHLKKGNYLRNCYQYSKMVYAELQKFPDAIIYSQGLSVWYGITNLKKHLVVNPHGLEPYQGITLRDKLTTLPFRPVMRKIFKNAAYVISLGGKLTTILKEKAGVDKNKIVVLPNAVNLPAPFEKKSGSGKLNFLFVGRFAHNKGITLMLDVIKELNDDGYEKKLHFTFVGKGPLYETVTQQYIFSNITFAGAAGEESLQELYRSSDVFVFPTLFEGMPTVVLEAMSYAMPVIVSDVGATAELVDNTNGILIEKNNRQQLKQAIIDMSEMTETERKKLAQNSLEKVKQKFTWQRVAQMHLELFQKINV